MKNLLIIFLLFPFFSFCQGIEISENPILFHHPENQSRIEYYQDLNGNLQFNDILNKEFINGKEYRAENINHSSTHWFRIKLKNKSALYKLWFFELTDPHVREINLWQISGGDTIAFEKTGFDQNFDTRFTNHKNVVFPIRFNETDSLTLILAFKNNYTFNLSINLRPAEQFINYALVEYYLLGLFYGILLIMAIYNFFIFLSTREKVYIFYVAYVISYSISAFREDGMGFQFLWPNTPALNKLFEISYNTLLILSFAAYSKEFLNLKSNSARWNFWVNISAISYVIASLVDLFITPVPYMWYLYVIPFTVIYSAGVYIWKKGNKPAKYFLLAFSFLIVSFTIFVLRITEIIPTNVFTVYALNFGFLLEVVLFSYALGQRLRIQKDEKAKTDQLLITQLKENERLKDILNKELERKVEERTQELAEALEELREKNLKIEELNMLLLKDNKQLNEEVKHITKARLMLKDLTLDEFQKIYPDEDSCLKYLSEIKWSKAYSCKKCSNKTASEGKTPFSKRCTKCGYDESATSFTIFHNSKLPINKTFYLVYLILANRNISSHELGQKLELRQKTCWAFKKKVIEATGVKGSGKINSKEWGKIFYNQA
ncbi:MAG: 7TM diverse intracellular signaling domain-containing protein [Cytophagaceae bacterium]